MRCEECGMKECCGAELGPEIERLRETINELKKQMSPRDARVEPPVCDIEYLVFDPAGREWVRDTANPDDWLEICKDFDDAPFYLPMPPAPEEK